jgi:erythromycin esterase-like protein
MVGGFTTYTGTVTAASDSDTPHERKRVRQALPESYENLFHETSLSNFLLNLWSDDQTGFFSTLATCLCDKLERKRRQAVRVRKNLFLRPPLDESRGFWICCHSPSPAREPRGRSTRL